VKAATSTVPQMCTGGLVGRTATTPAGRAQIATVAPHLAHVRATRNRWLLSWAETSGASLAVRAKNAGKQDCDLLSRHARRFDLKRSTCLLAIFSYNRNAVNTPFGNERKDGPRSRKARHGSAGRARGGGMRRRSSSGFVASARQALIFAATAGFGESLSHRRLALLYSGPRRGLHVMTAIRAS
jgi:hypothetical protein